MTRIKNSNVRTESRFWSFAHPIGILPYHSMAVDVISSASVTPLAEALCGTLKSGLQVVRKKAPDQIMLIEIKPRN